MQGLGAQNGEAALKAMRNRSQHPLLLDRDMPGMDGLDVCRRIKAEPAYKDVRVVFFSGVYRRPKSKAAAYEASADGNIERLIGTSELVAQIDTQAFRLGFEPPSRQEAGRPGG